MAWYQLNNFTKYKKNLIFKILIKFILLSFIFIFTKYNFNCNINCFTIRGVGEFLKEVNHNNKILVSTLDLPNHIVMLNYDKNREHFYKLFGLEGALNYPINKYFYLIDGKICSFSKFDSRSHFHLNLNYLEGIYSNFVFTHKQPYYDFSLINKKGEYDLFGEKNLQYISNRIYFYSNTHIPKYYDSINLKNNYHDFNFVNSDNSRKIKNFINLNEEFLLKHLLNSFNLKYKN